MRKLYLILGLWLVTGMAFSAIVTHLYSLSLPVSDRSDVARTAALNEAFATVLVRLSGDSAILQNDKIHAAAQTPDQYLSEYDYIHHQGRLYVHFTFSEPALKDLLSAAGAPLWGADRPAVLVWAVLNDGQGMQIMTPGSGTPKVWLTDLHHDAMNRGLPLMYPLLDIQDMQAISALRLWQGDVAAIRQASARYVPDAILLLRIDAQNPAKLQTQWQLLEASSVQDWQLDGEDAGTLIAGGVNHIADALAKSYALTVDSQQSGTKVVLQIRGLDNLTAYAQISRYLMHLTAVKAVSIWSASGDQVNFLVQTHGDASALVKEIALGRRLMLITPDAKQSNNSLVYQLAS